MKEYNRYDGMEPYGDVMVGYDGSWLTRGYGSKIGVGFVIHAETGIILALEVLLNYCQECKKHRNDETND